MDYPIRILLVDDRPDEYTSVEALLAGTPYKLVGATSGMEALRRLLEDEFALIIMDVMMPDMNGFETARRIKMRNKSRDIPIIFLTSLTSELENNMQAYSAGAIDYISKPFQPDILKSKIEGFVRLYQARKELELKSKQLEEANRVLAELKETAETALSIKSGFLAMMSHEIRTPLNGIMAMSDMLRNAKLQPEERGLAEIIHTSGQALLEVINHILDFSKIESGKMELEHTLFDCRSSVTETINLFKASANAKQLTLEADIAPDIPVLLVGDPNRLRQILNNLISNAVKFTERGGVNVKVRKGRQRSESVELIFVIEDTGIGVPPDKIKLLFQPFTQMGAEISGKFGGTGLGLSISKMLAEMMGGEIGADPGRTTGAAFRFTVWADTGKV